MNNVFEDYAQTCCLLILREQYRGHRLVGILPQWVWFPCRDLAICFRKHIKVAAIFQRIELRRLMNLQCCSNHFPSCSSINPWERTASWLMAALLSSPASRFKRRREARKPFSSCQLRADVFKMADCVLTRHQVRFLGVFNHGCPP